MALFANLIATTLLHLCIALALVPHQGLSAHRPPRTWALRGGPALFSMHAPILMLRGGADEWKGCINQETYDQLNAPNLRRNNKVADACLFFNQSAGRAGQWQR